MTFAAVVTFNDSTLAAVVSHSVAFAAGVTVVVALGAVVYRCGSCWI